MAIYDFFLSRNGSPSITAGNYVGHVGRLFYDSATGEIRISDGVTAGGLSIPITRATNTRIGGVKGGAGVTINSEGQILIDSAGLQFSFGDFESIVGTYAVGHPDAGEDYALLRSVNSNEDVVIASNGTGVVKVIGEFSVRKTNATVDGSLLYTPSFRMSADGIAHFVVDGTSTEAGIEVTANEEGYHVEPSNTGTLLHMTGHTDDVARQYIDGVNNYPILVGRRYNIAAAAPSQSLSGDVLFRIAANGALADGSFAALGPGRIEFRATENQSTGNQGGSVSIYATANGSTSTAAVETVKVESELVTLTGDLVPEADNTRVLGSAEKRWADVWIGPGTINITDQTLLTNTTLAVDNGVLQINGANQLQVGQLKFFENTIESTTGATDIQIGLTTSTANLVLNRNVVLARGKTLGLEDQLAPHAVSSLSVINGVLTVTGALGLQAGQIKILNNTIQSTTPDTSIQIGELTDTANLTLNRNVVIGTGKTLNATTVNNGVYTTDTGTVTNNMLAGSIANNKLANSTISGVALGSNLAALSAGNYLTGTDYTGATARTFAVDATTTNTASKVVARDANGTIAATNTVYPTRNAGSFGSGQTLTVDFATDRFVRATITGETVTVAYTNITPGKEIYIFFTNSSGGDLEVNSGVANQNATNAKGTENVKNGGTSQIRVTSFGTTVNDIYVHFKK